MPVDNSGERRRRERRVIVMFTKYINSQSRVGCELGLKSTQYRVVVAVILKTLTYLS